MSKRSSVRMEIVGLDLGDRYSTWCLCKVGGEVVSEGKVRTTAEALTRQFGTAPRRRIVLETGTHSLWVARQLRSMGHEVHVLHARSLRLITASRRKTDRLDARALAQFGATTSVEALHTVDVIDESMQADRAVLLARDLLVRARTQQVAHVRGVAKAWGVRLCSATTKSFPSKVREQIPQALRPALVPILDSILRLNEAIAEYDERLEKLAEESYPHSRLLTQVYGVGTLSALAYLWTIRDPRRFAKSRQVGAFVGLTAASRASGQRDPQLRITKQGSPLLRRLLVQCAHHILSRNEGDSDLRRFGLRIAAQGGRRGKKRAVVAVARKLAVLLHHLWKTGEVYVPNLGGDAALKRAA